MSNDQLKLSLIKIRESLNANETVDEETLALAKALESDLSKLVEAEDASVEEIETSVDLATALEARFESDHPVAASFVREIINALHKMGI